MAGARLKRTVDLFTVPYSLVLVGPRDGESLVEVGERIHRLLQFKTHAPPLTRARVATATFWTRLCNKAGWLAERARCALANK